MNKIQKQLNFTCPECYSAYRLLEKHKIKDRPPFGCPTSCLSQWKSLLHSHFQEQIILHLAQEQAQKDQKDHDSK